MFRGLLRREHSRVEGEKGCPKNWRQRRLKDTETLDDAIVTLEFGFEINSGRFSVRGAAPVDIG